MGKNTNKNAAAFDSKITVGDREWNPELDVTEFIEEIDCGELSASQIEKGPKVGQITWANCMRLVRDTRLVAPEHIDHVIDYFLDFGAWTRDELEDLGDHGLNALLAQEIAAAVREYEDGFDSPEDYMDSVQQGIASGRIYPGDNGRWYFYLGM